MAPGDGTKHFHQLGYVTNSLDRARAAFEDMLGLRFFRERERSFQSLEFGTQGQSILRNALANTATAQYEIVQPIRGQVSVFAEGLETNGFVLRLHHIAYRFEGALGDWLSYLERLTDRGRSIVWQSVPDETGAFAYTDDRENLGHYVEHLWSTPERWAATMDSVPYN